MNSLLNIFKKAPELANKEPIMASTISKTLKRTPTSSLLTVAAGCFWGTEHIYLKHFKDRLLDTKVGYANGFTEGPDYKQVCSGNTNHAEVLQVSFEPTSVSYRELVEFFFLMHDPTTINSQGPDIGTQYRSMILTHDDNQTSIAHEVMKEMQPKWYPNHKIVTVIEPIKSFYDAEDYHQLYLFNNPQGYQCPSHFIRTTPKA